METLEFVLNIVLVAASVLLILVVAMQKSKSSGLGAAFGGESPSLAPRAKTASREVVLQKITVVVSIIIALLAIAITVVTQLAK